MGSAAVTPVLPTDVLCILMDFLDIRTLKAASLVNRDFKYGADRLIWQSFYICVRADVEDVATADKGLRKIEEGCRIACTRIRPQCIRKFTLTFREYYWGECDAGCEFEQSVLGIVFATLRLLTGLRQWELDLTGASWRDGTDGLMSNLIQGPFPFQLERFTFNAKHYEMDFLSEFLPSQKRITTLFINCHGFTHITLGVPPRPRPLRVLDSGERHLLKNRAITHLFVALMDADEVFDLFNSLNQSTATLQLLWFRALCPVASRAFFQFAADPIAATVVSNLRYLVLETVWGRNIHALSLFSSLEELVKKKKKTRVSL